MSRCKPALFGAVAVLTLAAAGGAQAQFFEVDLTSSRTGAPAGHPTTVQIVTFPIGPNGQQQQQILDIPVLSTRGFDRFGATVDAIIGSLNPTYSQRNPGVQLTPATTTGTNTISVSIPSLGDLGQAVIDAPTSFESHDNCFDSAAASISIVGNVQQQPASPGVLPPGRVLGNCDKLDGTLTLSGVSFMFGALEDSTAVRLAIPTVGYNFTTAATSATRSDALKLIEDNFFASGKAQPLAAKLLGLPDGTTLPKGSLPDKGTLITGSATVGGVTKSFAIDTPAQALAYYVINHDAQFSDFGLNYSGDCFRVGTGPAQGTCSAATATFSIAGVEVNATAVANSTDVTFSAPALGLQFTSSNAEDREEALNAFIDYASETVDDQDLTRAYARYLAETNPSDPLVGNPYSAQGQLNRASLDLDSPSEALDENKESRGGRARPDDPAGWMIGGRAGYLDAGSQGAEFADAVFERGWRIKEGSRARFKLSVPLSYIHYGSRSGGGQTATFGVRGALELPIIDGRWVVEPSAAASAFYSDNIVSSGALYAVGISSRYKIAPIGRGHIVIGNAVNYSSTIEIKAGSFASPKIQNTAVRNGIAYQIPYGRFLGRQGTVRASYTYTHLFGDEIAVEDYHEMSLSYGVASREAAVKQIGETLRFGINGAIGHDFTAVSLTAGYRF